MRPWRGAVACSCARPAPSSWCGSWWRRRRPRRPSRSATASSPSCRAPRPRLQGRMCGIVGYVGDHAAQEILLAGLRSLEYRGYDSAGISLIADGEIESVRAVGNLDNLVAAVERAEEGGGVAVA